MQIGASKGLRRADYCTLSVGALSVALSLDQRWFAATILLIMMAFAMCAIAMRRSRGPSSAAVVAAVCAVTAILLPGDLFLPSGAAVALAATTCGAVLTRKALVSWGLLLFATCVSVWRLFTVATWGSAGIDVFRELQGATGDLLHGKDPYSGRYLIGFSTGSQHVGRLAHFDYEPWSLVLSLPGRALGDVRVSCAIALGITAWALYRLGDAGDSRSRRLMVALFLSTTFPTQMILNAYTEVYPGMFLVLFVLFAQSRPRSAVVSLAVGMASKLTVALALLPLVITYRPFRVQIVVSAIVAGLLCIPFALWNGPGNFFAAIIRPLQQPFLIYGPSLDGFFFRTGHPPLPSWLGLLITLMVSAPLLLRVHGNLDRAMTAAGGFLIASILFGPWAWINYYYIAVVCILASAALSAAHSIAAANHLSEDA